MQTATTSPTSAAGSSVSSRRRSATPWALILAAALMIYTFIVGGALLGGIIPAGSTWLLMALPCLAPMIWCAAGFLRGLGDTRTDGEQSAGLLLSVIGWALIAVSLVAKHFAVVAAQPDAYASQATSPITPLCAGLGVLCLLIGAAVSWFSWKRETDGAAG